MQAVQFKGAQINFIRNKPDLFIDVIYVLILQCQFSLQQIQLPKGLFLLSFYLAVYRLDLFYFLLNKTFLVRSIDYLQEVSSLPLSLPTLQNLLLGNPVFIDSVVSFSNDNNTITLLSIGNSFKNLVTIKSDNNFLMHSKLDDVDIARSRTADLSYDDYENKKGRPFSSKRRITVAEKNKLDISLNFKQYDFDEEVNFPFSIPKNYKQR